METLHHSSTVESAAPSHVAHTERLALLGELAAGVAHDFNNALSTITGRIEVIKQKLILGDDIDIDVEVIEAAAQNATEVVERIREFSQPNQTSTTFQKIDMQVVANKAVQFIRTRIPAGVTLRVDTRPTPLIMGRPNELIEVLLNLASNALDAVGEMGVITIGTHHEDERVIVEVKDNGHGIPEHLQQKIFEPFFSTNAESGTGLGLSVSRWILDKHGARTELCSAVNEGTSFRLVFPIATGETAQPRRVQKAQLTILVVEDDDSISEMLQDLLSAQGHIVFTAEHAERALEQLDSLEVDLILTDLDLPKMNGWDLASQIRTTRSAVVIGLVTGWPVEISQEQMHSRGVDFILRKPFSLEDLRSTLRSVCAQPVTGIF